MQYVPYLILLYAVVSVVILWAHQKTRLYPLYLLKTLWVGFSLLAFAWVVAMSFGESKEYIQNPAGPMEILVGNVVEITDEAGVKKKRLEGGYVGALHEYLGMGPYWMVAFLLMAWFTWGLSRNTNKPKMLTGEAPAESLEQVPAEDLDRPARRNRGFSRTAWLRGLAGTVILAEILLFFDGSTTAFQLAAAEGSARMYFNGWRESASLIFAMAVFASLAEVAPRTYFRHGGRCLFLMLLLALTPMTKPLVTFHWSRYKFFADNYAYAWNEGHIGEYFINSLIVTITTVAMTTLFGAMAAYVIARRDFRGRNLLYGAIIGSIAIPGILIQVPLFLLIKDWGFDIAGYHYSFMDSRLGLAIIYSALSLPFTIFVLAGFFRTLPGSLGEAACIDGCGRWRTFTQVYLPLAMPGIATTGIFNFLGAWNEFNLGMIFMSNPNFKTLPIGLYELQAATQYSAAWAPMFAGIVLLCLPTFVIFLVLQERIVAGLTAGGVKG